MPTNPLLRFRRSAAQLHALAEVERTIRATDTKCRRKYLRDFSNAFRSYRRVLRVRELEQRLTASDIVLVGDYHALPASQLFTASLLEKIAASGQQVILGVEAIVARDQHILEEWQRHEIDSEELRNRIRFELDWGYDWQPFRELLERTRSAGGKIVGLDCTPRQDMRSIRARDRHAAIKIAELRRENPGATVVVLFGESHLAPTHLPQIVKDLRPNDDVLTVLQNVDTLYWLSAGEPDDLVEAVEVCDDVLCVFSATPLEKYEHYRLCIERWKLFRLGRLDLAPSFYNLISSLFQFLNVNPYSTRCGQGAFLVDQLPEVCSVSSEEQLERLIARRLSTRGDEVRKGLAQQGSYFISERNVIVAREFRMPWAAEQAARFVHYACNGGRAKTSSSLVTEDNFYVRVIETALGFLGSKILCPSRKLYDETDFFKSYSKSDHEVAEVGLTRRAYQHVLDWIVFHKDYERNRRRYHQPPAQLISATQLDTRERELASTMLGHLLGSELYTAYVRGQISKRVLKNLFFRKMSKPGAARSLYLRAAQAAPVAGTQRRGRMLI